MKILKAQLTSLLSPFGSTDTAFTLVNLLDSKGNAINLASFGTWIVFVLKSGDTTEMVRCSSIVQNSDGSVTISVATNGRDLDPTSPYAGSSIGQDFPAGSDVLITNDPYTMNKFVNVEEDAELAGKITFDQVPSANADPVAGTDLTRLSYVQALVLGTLTTIDVIVPGKAGATIAKGNLIYFDDASNEWKLADATNPATVNNVLLGIAQGAGTSGNAIAGGVLLQGEDAGQSGLTNGQTYYASNTPGAIASSAGTTNVAIGIGGATATLLYFAPRFNQQLTQNQIDALAGDAGTPSSANKFLTQQSIIHVSGMMMMFAGSAAPSGWLICDGSAVSRSTYAALFGIVGTTYGAGDGSTTFNLPDLRSRNPMGVGTGTKVFTFASRASNVLTVTGAANAASNEIQTGEQVTYASSGTDIGGLSAGTYFLIRIAYNQFSLATTLANAQAGTAVSLSSDGTGTRTFTITLTARALADTGGEEAHSLVLAEGAPHSHNIRVWSSGSNTNLNQSAGAPTTGSPINTGAGTDTVGSGNPHNTVSPFLAVNFIIKT